MTTPGVDDDFDYKAAGAKASKEAADIAFKDNPSYKERKKQRSQVALDNQSAADDAMGRPTSSDNNDSPIVRPPRPAPKPSPIYDNVAAGDYDDDSTGVHKGALIDKPKVKKVVKGLKKASKLHAKQAKTLEKEVKKKSK